MNYKMMGRFISQILIIEALFISLGYGEYPTMWSFLVSIVA